MRIGWKAKHGLTLKMGLKAKGGQKEAHFYEQTCF